MRRVELHGRFPDDEYNEPWSIRQTVVYQKVYPGTGKKPVLILIAPSKSVENLLHNSMENIGEYKNDTPLFDNHLLLIADSLKSWQEYIASLEMKLREQVSTDISLLKDVC